MSKLQQHEAGTCGYGCDEQNWVEGPDGRVRRCPAWVPPQVKTSSRGRNVPVVPRARPAGTPDVVSTGMDPWWESTAKQALRTLAASGRPFDAGDLRDLGVGDPANPNHWGAIFNWAAGQNLIRKVGATISTTSSRRGGTVNQWIGAHIASAVPEPRQASPDELITQIGEALSALRNLDPTVLTAGDITGRRARRLFADYHSWWATVRQASHDKETAA